MPVETGSVRPSPASDPRLAQARAFLAAIQARRAQLQASPVHGTLGGALSAVSRLTTGVDPATAAYAVEHPIARLQNRGPFAVRPGQQMGGTVMFGAAPELGAATEMGAARTLATPPPLHGYDLKGLLRSKHVIPAYHGTTNLGINRLNMDSGWFSTDRTTAAGRGPNVIEAAVTTNNPLHLKAKADFASMTDGIFAKLVTSADALARRGRILSDGGDVHSLTMPERIDAARKIAVEAITEKEKNPNMTVGQLLNVYARHLPPHELDGLLTHAGYDAIVNEAQPALRAVDLANPDAPGTVVQPRYNVRPVSAMHYAANVRNINEPGIVAKDATDRLRAFDTLLRGKIARAKTGQGRLTPQQLAQLSQLVQKAGARLRLYKGADNPEVTYHGTHYVFDRYKPSKVRDSSLYGPGLYTTNGPDVADTYVEKEQPAQTFTQNVRGLEHVQRILKENPSYVYLGHRKLDSRGTLLGDELNPALPATYRAEVAAREQRYQEALARRGRILSDGGDVHSPGISDKFKRPIFPFRAEFGDRNIAQNVRAQRIITKNPFDVRNEATLADKRAILRALRDAFQQGKRANNTIYNRGEAPRQTPIRPGSFQALLRPPLSNSVYPPRLSDYAGSPLTLSMEGKWQPAGLGRLRSDRADRREFGLAGEVMKAENLDQIHEALRNHLGNYRLVNRIIRKAGYDSIRHEGGRIMGGRSHDVTVALRPAQVRHPGELPAAQKVLKEATDALGRHVGLGHFSSDLEKRAFLRAYVDEALGIFHGKRALKTPAKQ